MNAYAIILAALLLTRSSFSQIPSFIPRGGISTAPVPRGGAVPRGTAGPRGVASEPVPSVRGATSVARGYVGVRGLSELGEVTARGIVRSASSQLLRSGTSESSTFRVCDESGAFRGSFRTSGSRAQYLSETGEVLLEFQKAGNEVLVFRAGENTVRAFLKVDAQTGEVFEYEYGSNGAVNFRGAQPISQVQNLLSKLPETLPLAPVVATPAPSGNGNAPGTTEAEEDSPTLFESTPLSVKLKKLIILKSGEVRVLLDFKHTLLTHYARVRIHPETVGKRSSLISAAGDEYRLVDVVGIQPKKGNFSDDATNIGTKESTDVTLKFQGPPVTDVKAARFTLDFEVETLTVKREDAGIFRMNDGLMIDVHFDNMHVDPN